MIDDEELVPDPEYLLQWFDERVQRTLYTATYPPNPIRHGLPDIYRPELKHRTYRALLNFKHNEDGPYDTYKLAHAWRETGGFNTIVIDQLNATTNAVHWLPIYPDGGVGFSWGYGGTGPHTLALALLLDALDEWPTRKQHNSGYSLSDRWHWIFARDFTMRWPQDEVWTLTGKQVDAWLTKMRKADPDTPKIVQLELQMEQIELRLGELEARSIQAEENGGEDTEANDEARTLDERWSALWKEMDPLKERWRDML
jgi:hypothetical protein